MKVLIAPDSFKNCLSADSVANCLKNGFSKIIPEENVTCFPISDGGEGFCKNLTIVCNGNFKEVETVDSLFRPIKSKYGVINDNIAIMDIASSSGLEMLEENERNPLFTSSFGSGLMLKHILQAGFAKVIIGLGGSSTTDGGIGLAGALGIKFYDNNNSEIKLTGSGLGNLVRIDDSLLINEVKKSEFIAACDVKNHLYGKNGAALVYAKQKGASFKDSLLLDNNLKLLNAKLLDKYYLNCQKLNFSGAAGGIATGLKAFLKATLQPGVELYLRESKLKNNISSYDYIITGEGEMNDQTLSGKAPYGLAKIAKSYGVKIIAVTGKKNGNFEDFFLKIYELRNYASSIDESIVNADRILQIIGEEIGRLIMNEI
jgi:glycerate kinase